MKLSETKHFPAKGVRGMILKTEGGFFFRILDRPEGVPRDFRISHDDLSVEIVDESAEFYVGKDHKGEYDGYLDYTPEVLGNQP